MPVILAERSRQDCSMGTTIAAIITTAVASATSATEASTAVPSTAVASTEASTMASATSTAALRPHSVASRTAGQEQARTIIYLVSSAPFELVTSPHTLSSFPVRVS